MLEVFKILIGLDRVELGIFFRWSERRGIGGTCSSYLKNEYGWMLQKTVSGIECVSR